MKKTSTLMALMLALFTVILGLNSVQAAATTKTVINDKIWWLNDYGDKKFEDFNDFKHIGDVASNNWGITYFTPSGDLAWYSPKTGKTLVPLTQYGLKVIHVYGAFEAGDIAYARFVAGQNYLKGYDTLDKIKAAMNKPKGTATVATPPTQNQVNDGRVRINDKIGWRTYYGNDTSHTFEKYDDFKYVDNVARNDYGIFYFNESGDISWYNPETGNVLEAYMKLSDPSRRLDGKRLEGGAYFYAEFVAGQNYLKGYTSLDKIKAAMNKAKGTSTAPSSKDVSEADSSKDVPAVHDIAYSRPEDRKEPITAPKQGWVQDKGNWFYYDQQGRQKSGWVQVGGAWYYLASDGKMQTGWVNQGGVWYYLNGSGAMQTGWLNQSGTWYYLNGSGAMQTGWLSLSGTWYYLTSSGTMKTGWYQVSTKWYYSYGSGALAVSTTVDGYYVNANGEWV